MWYAVLMLPFTSNALLGLLQRSVLRVAQASVMHRSGVIDAHTVSAGIGAKSRFRSPNSQGMYSTAKLAQVLMAFRLQEELNKESAQLQLKRQSTSTASSEDTGHASVTVHCCNPGAVASDIWRHDGC